MKKIYTKNLHRQIQVDWYKWKNELMAEKYVPENDVWLLGLDVNCELCAYNNTIGNESAAYIEVSLNEKWAHEGANEGLLLRSHAVYNQSFASLPRPGLVNIRGIPLPIPVTRITPINNSGMLVEGFRSIMFPSGYGKFIKKGTPLYMHIQTKGHLTAGLHCNIFYCLAGEESDC